MEPRETKKIIDVEAYRSFPFSPSLLFGEQEEVANVIARAGLHGKK